MTGYSPEEIVTSFYRVILGREPDSGGYESNVNFLRNGATVESMLRGFSTGPEARKRFLSNFGIGATNDALRERFPVDYIPPPTEAGKTYARNCANGFFRRYMAGDVVLDVGYKGYDNPEGITVLPHAIGSHFAWKAAGCGRLRRPSQLHAKGGSPGVDSACLCDGDPKRRSAS